MPPGLQESHDLGMGTGAHAARHEGPNVGCGHGSRRTPDRVSRTEHVDPQDAPGVVDGRLEQGTRHDDEDVRARTPLMDEDTSGTEGDRRDRCLGDTGRGLCHGLPLPSGGGRAEGHRIHRHRHATPLDVAEPADALEDAHRLG